MVPVRVEGGAGDDTFRVGNATNGLNDIQYIPQPNLNDLQGLGPVVLIGGAGHDTVIADDTGDGDAGEESGNIYAVSEKRVGIAEEVEVGIISGLGMTAKPVGEANQDGRIEFEEVEVAQVLLDDSGTVFTVGGAGFNLNPDDPFGGAADTIMRTTTMLPKGRLPDPANRTRRSLASRRT